LASTRKRRRSATTAPGRSRAEAASPSGAAVDASAFDPATCSACSGVLFRSNVRQTNTHDPDAASSVRKLRYAKEFVQIGRHLSRAEKDRRVEARWRRMSVRYVRVLKVDGRSRVPTPSSSASAGFLLTFAPKAGHGVLGRDAQGAAGPSAAELSVDSRIASANRRHRAPDRAQFRDEGRQERLLARNRGG
jgi:hypothetical protein